MKRLAILPHLLKHKHGPAKHHESPHNRCYQTIANRHTILPTIAQIANHDNQNCVEYIFTKPYWLSIFSFLGFTKRVSAINPYGHSSIRYCYKDLISGLPIDTVMNVSGQKGTRLVNFIDTDKYLFTDAAITGNEQGGVFNRSFISVRISDVPTHKIVQMDAYFKSLDKQQTDGTVGYGMLLHIFTNPIRRLLGLQIKGNCSFWTSKGLIEAGIIKKGSSWPLSLWFKVLVNQMDTNRENVNIIAYRSIKYDKEPTGSLIHPLFPFTSILKFRFSNPYKIYWNLDSFADIILTPHLDTVADETTYVPLITRQDHVAYRWENLKAEFRKIMRVS